VFARRLSIVLPGRTIVLTRTARCTAILTRRLAILTRVLTIVLSGRAAIARCAATTCHTERNRVASIELNTGIHSSGPRGVGSVSKSGGIHGTRRLYVRRGLAYRKCKLVHSIHVFGFFLYHAVCEDVFEFDAHAQNQTRVLRAPWE